MTSSVRFIDHRLIMTNNLIAAYEFFFFGCNHPKQNHLLILNGNGKNHVPDSRATGLLLFFFGMIE